MRNLLLFAMLFFLVPALFFPSQLTLIRNVSVYLPDGKLAADHFIMISGSKIKNIGPMEQLDKKTIADIEYDLSGYKVYPAFIDAYYTGLQGDVPKDKGGKRSSDGMPSIDKSVRPSFHRRNLFIKRKCVDMLDLSETKLRKIMSSGFGFLHVVPENGIIGGTTVVISVSSSNPEQAVLVPQGFLSVNFRTNPSAYPTTLASFLAELQQLKQDCLYRQLMKEKQFYHPSKRLYYTPELDVLNPYMLNKKRFLVKTKNIVEQRIFEMMRENLEINPVMVGCSEIWRRAVDPRSDIVLLLDFKPPLSSKYAKMGEDQKKKAEKTLNPDKLAGFFRSHPRISLAPSSTGDYKNLFKNIRLLLERGISERQIIKSLTVIPARLLGIERYAGQMAAGRLASFIVCKNDIFDKKNRIEKMFIEGKMHGFSPRKGKSEPPAGDMTGNWVVKIQGQMNFELKMTIEQEGNFFTGKLISSMGTMEINDGFISGSKVTFSTSAPIGGQDTRIEVSGDYQEGEIRGTIHIGSFGAGSLLATPENLESDLAIDACTREA